MVSRSTAGAFDAHTQHADALAQAGDLFCDLRSMDLVLRWVRSMPDNGCATYGREKKNYRKWN